MSKAGKKRSRKQGKRNLRRRTRADIDKKVTTSKGESAKELIIRQMYIPRRATLVLTGHDPTWTKAGSCRNIFQRSHMCATKPTRNWFQEIFLQAIADNSFSTGQLLPRLLLGVLFTGFVFAFAFNFRPANTNGIILPSIWFLPRLEQSISPGQSRNLDH